MQNIPNKFRSRSSMKCHRCRVDRKKCLPEIRDWDLRQEKCERCSRGGFPCGPATKKPSSLPKTAEYSSSLGPPDLQPEQKLFACPFTKLDFALADPETTVGGQYEECASSGFRNIADLHEHLQKVHLRAESRCSRCLEHFASSHDVSRHLQDNKNCSRIASNLLEKQSFEIWESIERNTGSISDTSMWNDICRILFPARSLPVDPYVKDSTVPLGQSSSRIEYERGAEARPARISAKFLSLGINDAEHPSEHISAQERTWGGMQKEQRREPLHSFTKLSTVGAFSDSPRGSRGVSGPSDALQTRKTPHDEDRDPIRSIPWLEPHDFSQGSPLLAGLPAWPHWASERNSDIMPIDSSSLAPGIAPTDFRHASVYSFKQIQDVSSVNARWNAMIEYCTASVETSIKDSTIHKFASQIFNDMGGQKLNEFGDVTLDWDLPALFADFALRLGQGCSDRDVRDTMVFIHRYRRYVRDLLTDISRCFKSCQGAC